jgi:YcxB-like protein
VSDTSQGPGWWLASDGKWYPPSASPGTPINVAPARLGSPGAPDSVAIQFTLTKAEFTKSMRWVVSRDLKFNRRLLPAIALMVVAAGIVLISTSTSTPTSSASTSGGDLFGFLLLGCAALICLVLVWMSFGIPAIMWNKSPTVHELQLLSYSEAGISARSNFAESQLDWKFYSDTFETKDCYVLKSSRRSYVFIPKRAFVSRLDEIEFRRLVVSHTDSHLLALPT